jgi:plastocyanin
VESQRALLHRALGTVAVAALAASTVFVGATRASADHADHETCRSYAEVPNPFVKVMAEDNTFDTNCIKAPAGRNFRIYFQNNDGDAHNISVYSADPAVDKKAKQLYKGKAIKGPGQEEYALEGLEAGKYWFQDDKVKTMNGSLEVAKGKKAG